MVIVAPILGLLLCNYPEDKGLKPYGETEVSDTVSSRSDGKQSTGDGIEYVLAVRMPVFYGLIVFAFLMNAAATLNVFVPTYMQEIQFSVEQASFVASAVMVGVTVGKVFLGMINDPEHVVWYPYNHRTGYIGLGAVVDGAHRNNTFHYRRFPFWLGLRRSICTDADVGTFCFRQ